METFQNLVLPWLILLGILSVLVILYLGENKKGPAWIQKIAFLIRKLFKLLLYLAALVFLLGVLLPVVVQEGAMWLFPNSTFGYAAKYEVRDEKVYVQPKPHDCEWGKAPIGNKYCHFERTISTGKNEHGKVTEVYVGWQRVEE